MNFSRILGRGTAAVGATMAFAWLLLHMLGGVFSGIWLLIEGEWRMVLGGFLASLVMPWAWSWVCLPLLGLGAVTVWAYEKRRHTIAAVAALLGNVISNLLITLWALLVFSAFVLNAGTGPLVPLAIYGYATTMSPLAYMASKEPSDDEGSNLGLLNAMAVYILATIAYSLSADVLVIVLVALAVPALISVHTFIRMTKLVVIEREKDELRSLHAPVHEQGFCDPLDAEEAVDLDSLSIDQLEAMCDTAERNGDDDAVERICDVLEEKYEELESTQSGS